MCGIVGIASKQNCINDILKGLKSLEYRGYDSSGIAYEHNRKISDKKAVGKISELEKKIDKKKFFSNLIIGHTRWATHGKPSLINCHPFIKENCSIVHNGIIENYEDIIDNYSLNKYNIKSDTDSEVVAEFFNSILKKINDPINAIKFLNKKLEGNSTFAFLLSSSNFIYASRKGSPLVLGLSNSFNSISSDVLGLPDSTNEIIFLEENDIVELSNSSFSIFNKNGKKVSRDKHDFVPKNEFKIKGKFKHFMLKEIFHQPISIEDTVLNFADKKTNSVFLPKSEINFSNTSSLILVACGTAYHACMIAKYWIEQMTNLSVSIDIGSEYRYKKQKIDKSSLGIVVSQSGETMDTLESLKKFKLNKIPTIAVVNVINSSIARQCDYILPTLAGPEIGVASTKAFTSQLVVLALLTLHLQSNDKNKLDNKIFKSLFRIHENIKEILKNSKKFENVAMNLRDSKSIFYIGRGTMFPLALEGALKLKEITYKHCEGYAAGELKHGPLALIENDIPVIALAPFDHNFSKILSNIQEIKARGGRIIIITDDQGFKKSKKYCDYIIKMPRTNFMTSSILYSIPIQLIAYHLAVLLGTDVDQPRNLAKSVTVE